MAHPTVPSAIWWQVALLAAWGVVWLERGIGGFYIRGLGFNSGSAKGFLAVAPCASNFTFLGFGIPICKLG